MPLTPYHFGPGVLIKSAIPDRFSLTAFALTEVAVDVEVAYYLTQTEGPLHRHFHTLLGASTLAAIIGVSLFAVRGVAHRTISALAPNGSGPSGCAAELSNTGIATGVAVGAVLAVGLDAVMHSDVHPFWPVTVANPFLGLLDLGLLHGLCVVSGFLGLGIMMVRSTLRDAG